MKFFGGSTQRKPRAKKRESALGRRRRRMFRIKLVLLVLILIVILSVAAWLLRHPEVTLNTVVVHGNDITSTEEIHTLVEEELSRSYLFIIPKKSTFFYPKRSIEKLIDEAFPRIKEVEVRKQNFTTLRVDVEEREPYALWCGDEYVPDGDRYGLCYFIDDRSYLYAGAPDFSGNVFFKYFGRLAVADEDRYEGPLGSLYMREQDFYGIRPFILEFEELGYAPVSLTKREDGDFELRMIDGAVITFGSDTKLSVLLDNMESILDSESFKASEGKTLEYIDLRFGNKVYYKFRDEEEVIPVLENVVE